MKIILPILLLVLVSACIQAPRTTNTTFPLISGTGVALVTEDNVTLGATYWDRATAKKVILVHMYGRSKEDWNRFGEQLPYTTIAIDLRGHGDSGGRPDDTSNMVKDIAAARKFLGNGTIIIVGASLGANVAINYAAESGASGVALLSPSYDYQGVTTLDAIKSYKGDLLIVTSRVDELSYQDSLSMVQKNPGIKRLKLYEGAGHGTTMFVNQDLGDFLKQWISEV